MIITDLTGHKFYNLTVVDLDHKENGKSFWLCKCDCGNNKIIRGDHLTSGAVHSCGCKKKKQITNLNRTKTRHGQWGTRLYGIWNGMKERCNNCNCSSYPDYWGRGIKVCEEWNNDFSTFYSWSLQHGYADDLSIDRIDVNGNYEPNNCRWITLQEQNENKRNNIKLTYKGKTKTLPQWSTELGIKSSTLRNRVNEGWSVDKIIETPPLNQSSIDELKEYRSTGLTPEEVKDLISECETYRKLEGKNDEKNIKEVVY